MPTQLKPVDVCSSSQLFFKGFCMGIADVIPGVSGATVAFIFGIYADLLEAIKRLNPVQIGLILKSSFLFFEKKRRKQIMTIAKEQQLLFLMPVVSGVFLAIFVASHVIPPLLAAYPAQTDSLFFGLILASVIIPLSRIPRNAIQSWLILLFFAWMAYSLVGLPRLFESGSLYFTFFSGAIAICAIILPGISGSYLLQALGQYEFILSNFHQALRLQVDAVLVVLVFVAGIILGITSFVRILTWSLRFYRTQTVAALTGMMLGALRAVWPFQDVDTNTIYLPLTIDGTLLICLALFLTGMLMAGVMLKMNRRSL